MKFGNLPFSAIKVMIKLAEEGPLTPSQLSTKSKIAPRTVSFALKRLRKHKLCKRSPNLHDMRKPLYSLNKDTVDRLKLDLDRWVLLGKSL